MLNGLAMLSNDFLCLNFDVLREMQAVEDDKKRSDFMSWMEDSFSDAEAKRVPDFMLVRSLPQTLLPPAA